MITRSDLMAVVVVAGLTLAGCSSGVTVAEADDFHLPPGFEISLFADHTLAHDIYKMTVDPQGRLVVSGPNYIKLLEDTNGDGRADRVAQVSDFPQEGARGLYVDREDLIVVGDRGVWRMSSYEEKGFDERYRTLLLPHGGRGDHNANTILKGPDGWFYLITGDNAEIGPEHATLEGSPVRRPLQGALLRMAPDGSASEVIAHGFRNPYDMAFNAYGHVFTYDADGERVQYLPWYVPARAYDVAQGMLHGWIFFGMQYWNPPAHFFDHTERLAETGRGSPTGVVVYRHRRFPERYRGGLFLADWSYGRIYFLPLEREGAGYRADPEVFLQVAGARGFAVTAADVGPEGDIFVSIGGRGTRGEIYRIRYTGSGADESSPRDPLRRVLAAGQPLSSWSRAEWIPEAEALGREAFEAGVADRSLPVRERIRALEVLVEVFGGVPMEFVREVTSLPEADARLVARALWALSLNEAAVSTAGEGKRLRAFLAEMTHVDDPWIARHAWESIGRLPLLEAQLDPDPNWLKGFDSGDRRVRTAAYLAARGPGFDSFSRNVDTTMLATPRQRLGFLYAHGPDHYGPEDGRKTWMLQGTEIFKQAADPITRIDALRLLQIGLGDIKLTPGEPGVNDGYQGADSGEMDPELLRKVAERLGPLLPTGTPAVDVELARLVAMLETAPAGFLERVAEKWTEESTVQDDIHYLLVSMRLPGERTPEVTRKTARAVVSLQVKMYEHGYQPSRFWPGRVAATFERLLDRDSALAAAVVGRPELRLAGHALLADVLPAPYRTEAARKLLAASLNREALGEQALTPELAELFSILPPDEFVPVLRRHLDDPGLAETLIPILADHAEPADLDSFIVALKSREGRTVKQAARAVVRITERPTVEQWRIALRALDLFASAPDGDAVVGSLSGLLQHWADEADLVVAAGAEPVDVYRGWMDWFAERHPGAASQLRATADHREAFEAQLAQVNWNEGSIEDGGRIFSQLGCRTCHTGATRLGPSLEGVAGRFNPEDLFRIINDPDQVQWSAYETTEIVTAEGRTYTGILIYDSPAVRLMQMGDGETVHIEGEEIIEVRKGGESLMPSGLLRGLSPQELADLLAYLSTL